MELLLLHNEKNYVVAVKPRGVLSQCASSVTGNVPDMVKLLSERLQADIFPVHRLDRETAGVMVYAKNKRAAADFSSLAAQNGLDKRYLAAVTGTPEPPFGEMRDLLYHPNVCRKPDFACTHSSVYRAHPSDPCAVFRTQAAVTRRYTLRLCDKSTGAMPVCRKSCLLRSVFG